ncbi:hypothetical protein ACQSDT_07870 [Streptococcus infantarius]|uniref:hypothetical protein n=1 Tax=Streptococcus infantarius TaxID=102684 RepID=UPI003D10B3FF
MKLLKKGKRPLISDDIEVQKNVFQEYQKDNDDKPKTETAIVKSILSKRLRKRLEVIEDIIQRAESPEQADWLSRDLADERAVLREELRLLNSIPDVPYVVQRDNSKVIIIKGLDGNFFELSLSRKVFGGSIYQLKDSDSGQFVEIIESDYLNKVEKACINGYLIPDENLSNALEQLKK